MIDPLELVAAPIAEAARTLGAGAADAVLLEQPAQPEHGDYATTLALRLAKTLRRPPREVAEALRDAAGGSEWVSAAEIAGPGFLNLRLSPAWYARAVSAALAKGYGSGSPSAPMRVNVEYVSANPTGSLTVASARNAAYGDCLARLFEFAGHEVTREYYFNDSGNQIDKFGQSLRARARGEEVPEGGYPGEDVAALAARLELDPDDPPEAFARSGIQITMASIRETLERFRAHMDVWTNEADLHAAGAVERAIERARGAGHMFEADGAQWLRTTDFGDDKDRVVVRSDGSTTYLAADLAYLVDKLDRGYDLALYVLGADHHGYVGRLKAAAAALRYDPARVEVPIYQLVTVLDKRMGKRRGNVVFLDELLDAIGVDATRFFLAQRSHDQTIDIDIDLARSQSQENPVFYVQYAHARVASILRRAGASAGAAAPDSGLAPAPEEAALIRRLAAFGDVCSTACDARSPHRVIAYARDLAADYHVFYRECRVLDPADEPRTRSRLALCEAARRVLERSLDLVGVSAPHEM